MARHEWQGLAAPTLEFECNGDVSPTTLGHILLVVMRTTATIHLKSDLAECRFEWLDFDGDDCFKNFHVDVRAENSFRRFDFGPCAVNGLRKLSRFFKDNTQTTVGLGFRNPDIRCCDVHRTKDGYRFVFRFEPSGASEELQIHNPQMDVDDEFMRTVYSS